MRNRKELQDQMANQSQGYLQNKILLEVLLDIRDQLDSLTKSGDK